MSGLVISLCFLILMGSDLFGQPFAPVLMDSLERDVESYAYSGRGAFFPLRSCYVTWIEVRFDSVSFDEATNVLSLQGHVFNGNLRWEAAIAYAQLLVGEIDSARTVTPTIYVGNDSAGSRLSDGGDVLPGRSIRVEEWLSADSTGTFAGKISVSHMDDILCVVPPEHEQRIELAIAKFYQIGRLLRK